MAVRTDVPRFTHAVEGSDPRTEAGAYLEIIGRARSAVPGLSTPTLYRIRGLLEQALEAGEDQGAALDELVSTFQQSRAG